MTMIIIAKNMANTIANMVVSVADYSFDMVYLVLFVGTIIFAVVNPTQFTL